MLKNAAPATAAPAAAPAAPAAAGFVVLLGRVSPLSLGYLTNRYPPVAVRE